jgi:hypothetical protein
MYCDIIKRVTNIAEDYTQTTGIFMNKYGLLLLVLSSSFFCQAADEEGYRRMWNLVRSVANLPVDLFVKVRENGAPGFMVKVPSGSTYADLKEKIEEVKGIPYADQILSRDGQELSDYAVVSPMLNKSPLLEINSSQSNIVLR